jgi:hypothetical protein
VATIGVGTGFDQQVDRLIGLGYPWLARLSDSDFRRHLEPLAGRVPDLHVDVDGRIPYLLVISDTVAPMHEAMPLVELRGQAGYSTIEPDDLDRFRTIDEVVIPGGTAYLLVDVDTGPDTLNVTPDDALPAILGRNRSPLTVAEGVALVTQFPDVLTSLNCFSILGSRCGDRRVPAIWISSRRPRLGWCWAGNPHTWLGSASCGRRVGVPA